MRVSWLFFLLPSVLSELGINKRCITPHGELGKCIEFSSCPLFLKYSQNFLNNDYSVIKYFQQAVCGERLKMKLICCGEHDDPYEECGVMKKRTFEKEGTNAPQEHFPWMAAIRYRHKNGKPLFLCQGFLVNSQFLITAAHCLKHSGKIHSIVLGVSDLSNFSDQKSYKKVEDKNVSFHENYKYENDIGLIRIDPIKYEDNIRWICLPRRNSLQPDWYTVRGWGMNYNKYNSFTVPRQNFIPSLSYHNCTKAVENGINSTKIICAGGVPNMDACTGDSGGALMNKTSEFGWTAFGIVAFGSRDCSLGLPGVYTKIQYYSDWLNARMMEMLETGAKHGE